MVPGQRGLVAAPQAGHRGGVAPRPDRRVGAVEAVVGELVRRRVAPVDVGEQPLGRVRLQVHAESHTPGKSHLAQRGLPQPVRVFQHVQAVDGISAVRLPRKEVAPPPRFARPPQGGDTSRPAKPARRYLWNGLFHGGELRCKLLFGLWAARALLSNCIDRATSHRFQQSSLGDRSRS